jgi:hypothetical protein
VCKIIAQEENGYVRPFGRYAYEIRVAMIGSTWWQRDSTAAKRCRTDHEGEVIYEK